jgi:hypothetical protein
MTVIGVAAVCVAVAAAVRGTWSPCGLSMLSTITPIGERGRGSRYATTARWFVAGSVLGGLVLGGVAALFAVAVDRLDLTEGTAAVVSIAAALVSVASDARFAGFALPTHGRQVNERWLDEYRPWVYGGGFGFQVGTGFATYITSAANYLLVLLVALGGSWTLAVAVGVLFGLVRGLSVLLTRRVRSADDLIAVHARVQAAAARARAAVVATSAGGATAIALTRFGIVPALALLVASAGLWWRGEARRSPACTLTAAIVLGPQTDQKWSVWGPRTN